MVSSWSPVWASMTSMASLVAVEVAVEVVAEVVAEVGASGGMLSNWVECDMDFICMMHVPVLYFFVTFFVTT